jgi:hypothetical protein
MTPDLTAEEKAALLRDTIERDRFPLSRWHSGCAANRRV